MMGFFASRGGRELIKLHGIHPLIMMHLARRGGRRSEKKIHPGDVDGRVQNFRASITEEKMMYKDKNDKAKSAPKAGGAIPLPVVSAHVATEHALYFILGETSGGNALTMNLLRTTVLPTYC